MVATSALVGISVIALGLVLTPGPNMIYLVSRSIAQGRRAGLVSLVGTALGYLVYLIAAAVGLAAIFVHVPFAYTALKVVGAAYLLYLAWQAFRPGGASLFAPQPATSRDGPGRLVVMGVVTNLLNPKIAVLYLTLLPHFIDPARGPVIAQGLVLGAVQIVISLAVNAVIVVFAGSLASFLGARPRWQRAQRYLMGTVLAAFAVRLITDRAQPSAT